jgi:hypothetical protein
VVDRNLEPLTMLERDGRKSRIPKEKLVTVLKDADSKLFLEKIYGEL